MTTTTTSRTKEITELCQSIAMAEDRKQNLEDRERAVPASLYNQIKSMKTELAALVAADRAEKATTK